MTHLNAFGFIPATCRAFLVNCSATSCNRLKRAGLTDTTVVRAPSAVAELSAMLVLSTCGPNVQMK